MIQMSVRCTVPFLYLAFVASVNAGLKLTLFRSFLPV
jgi:hypothetical protein